MDKPKTIKKEPADAGKQRAKIRRRLGDAELTAGGASVFIGDMTRTAGVEVAVMGERDRADIFEG